MLGHRVTSLILIPILSKLRAVQSWGIIAARSMATPLVASRIAVWSRIVIPRGAGTALLKLVKPCVLQKGTPVAFKQR
jgi:uncharacterized protein YejL (UPF0352 family)